MYVKYYVNQFSSTSPQPIAYLLIYCNVCNAIISKSQTNICFNNIILSTKNSHEVSAAKLA